MLKLNGLMMGLNIKKVSSLIRLEGEVRKDGQANGGAYPIIQFNIIYIMRTRVVIRGFWRPGLMMGFLLWPTISTPVAHTVERIRFSAGLAPLGVKIVAEGEPDYGVELCPDRGNVSLCLFQTDEKPAHLHLAFTASSREQVDAFYHAALSAGGKDNGAPGLRPNYHAHYYAAFVIGPDGHNIEAVCHNAIA